MSNFITPDKNNVKTPISPIVTPIEQPSILEQVQRIAKSSEEKTYLVLYYSKEYDEFTVKDYTGRRAAYFGIRDMLESDSSIDVRHSIVLVETVALSPDGLKPKRYLTHLDNSINVFNFCKHVEVMFGDNAYSIEEYDSVENLEPTENDDTITNPWGGNVSQFPQQAQHQEGPRSPFIPSYFDNTNGIEI